MIKVKQIRNKLEHKMHAVHLNASSTNNIEIEYNIFDLMFEVNSETVVLSSGEIIKFIKNLNVLFSEIQTELVHFSEDDERNSKHQTEIYFIRMTRFDFVNFNEIFDSGLVKMVGKAMLQF